MTVVVWLLVLVVGVIAVFTVGLLRSHALTLSALHDAGSNLDPDRADDDHDQAHRHHLQTPATDSETD